MKATAMSLKAAAITGGFAATVLYLCSAASCAVPNSELGGPGADEGRLTVETSGVAPWIRQAASGNSRAYAFAPRQEFEIVDSSGATVAAWQYGAVRGDAFVSTSKRVSAGSGYVVKVRLFNDRVSPVKPVALGQSDPVSVEAGKTTEAKVVCLPNPDFVAVHEPGTPSSGRLNPYLLECANGNVMDPSDDIYWFKDGDAGEAWYRFEGAGKTASITAAPPEKDCSVAFAAFDSRGLRLASGPAPFAAPLSVPTKAGAAVYLVVVASRSDGKDEDVAYSFDVAFSE